MHLGECAVLGAVLRGQRAEQSDGEGGYSVETTVA